MRIDIYHHVEPEADERVTRLLHQILTQLTSQGAHMSAELAALTASVAKIKSADESIITLVKGLADQIRANAEDPAALRALAAELDSESDAVSAAVTENTPAQP